MTVDVVTGRWIASLPGAADTKDMWYDSTHKCIYEPSGEGFIFIRTALAAFEGAGASHINGRYKRTLSLAPTR